MSKVSAPFLSLDASGTVASTLTASKWKGRNYMRLRIIPANPQTSGQQTVRSVLGTLAKACHAVLTSFADPDNVGSQFFQDARDGAPSGQSWISWLQKIMYSNFAAQVSVYAGLGGTIQGYYVTAANLIGLSSYTDKMDVVHTSGEQLFLLAYFASTQLGYVMTGGITNPASTTPTEAFGTYVHTTTF